MKNKFVLDEEINLNEKHDFLNTKIYVQKLKDSINNAPDKETFTIGLFGEWGSGKSSIIKTLREELEKDTNTKKVKFISN